MFKTEIADVFLKIVNTFPDNKAFHINEKYYTYSDFARRIAAIASTIKDSKESSIGIYTSDNFNTYASIFAIWYSGKGYLPINRTAPAERNQTIIDSIGIKTILDPEAMDQLEDPSLSSSLEWIKNQVDTNSFENETAYILFTSGSTGTPKGVRISKSNLAHFVDAFREEGFDINENDRCLQMFDFTFDLSVVSYLTPLLAGACVYTVPDDRIKYSYVYMLMDDYDLTVSLMVPSVLTFLKPYFEEINCPKLRFSYFAGESLPEHLVEEWSKCVPTARIDNLYAPSESTIFFTYYNYSRDGKNNSYNGGLSIGKAMKNCTAVIFDENYTEIDEEIIGELCLAGPQITPGYVNNEKLNKELFFNINYNGVDTRFYKTGDLCLKRPNGNLEFAGRKDNQVKVQGYRIELGEIEFHANKGLNFETSTLVTTITNDSGNNEVAIVFESEEFDTQSIMEHLRANVPSYMIPSKTFFLKAFPLSKHGKVNRKEINKIIRQ